MHKYRISNNTTADSVAAKRCFDFFTSQANNFVGFIRDVSQDPFGFILISEIQVIL